MKSRSEKLAEDKRLKRNQKELDASDIKIAEFEINALIGVEFFELGPQWAEVWCEMDLKWADEENSYVTMPETAVEKLLELAREDADVFGLVRFIAASRIRSRVPIPAGLNDLIADYLTGRFVSVSKGAGRKVDTWERDFIIARTMQILESRWEHRRPTRRKDSGSPVKSISQIVHEALILTSIGLVDVDRIQRIRSEARKSKSLQKDHGMWVTVEFDDDDTVRRV